MGLLAAVLGIAGDSLWIAVAAAAIGAIAIAVLRTDIGIVVGIVVLPVLAALVFGAFKSVSFSH
jgi:hypothetical protein